MADKKISALTSASTPLSGTEVLPIVQSGATVKVPVSSLTAGRVVSASGVAVNATFKSWSVVNATQVGTGASFGGGVGFADGFATCNSYYDGAAWRRITATGASQVALTPSTGIKFNIAGTGTADSTMTWTEAGSFSALGDLTVNTGNLVIGTAGKGITDSTGGTTANFTSTEVTVNKPVVATTFTSVTGTTASTASGTPVTIFAVPSVQGNYIVTATLSAGDATNYNPVSILKVNGANSVLVSLSGTAVMTITLSGSNLQLTQNSGVAATMRYSIMRLL